MDKKLLVNHPIEIDLTPLGYEFRQKPLLVGGKAKEYYGVRQAGKDIDLIVVPEDYEGLAKLYPDSLKDLYGDLGVCTNGFEIWKTICLFNYDFLSEDAVEKDTIRVVSLEKLLFLTALGMKNEKYHSDLELIVQKIFDLKYKGFDDRKYRKGVV